MSQDMPDVMPRQISPANIVECTAEEADKLRAIDNNSGRQEKATEPPKNNGLYTTPR